MVLMGLNQRTVEEAAKIISRMQAAGFPALGFH